MHSNSVFNLLTFSFVASINPISSSTLQRIITRSYAFFKSKIKTRCKIFLFLFLIFWLPLSSSHFQKTKLIKLFKKYKSKLTRITMVAIHIQLTVPIVLWIIITLTLMRILFKMSCVIIYGHNQLRSLSWIDFSCVFNVGHRSLIRSASAIFCFRLLLKIPINNFKVYGVDILMWLLNKCVNNEQINEQMC